jgi:hypothetical protein
MAKDAFPKIWVYRAKRDLMEKRFRALKAMFDEIKESQKDGDTRAVGEILDAVKVVHNAMKEHILVKEHRKKSWRGQAKLEKLLEGLE